MRQKHVFQFKDFYNSNLFILACVFLLAVLVFSWARMLQGDYKVRSEIKRMEQEVTRLEAEQKRLSDLNKFFQSDFFAEQESRKSLGYALPGEKVVVLEQLGNKTTIENGDQPLTNPQEWWKYFFARD